MSSRARRLLERDREDGRCAGCGELLAGAALCESCEEAIAAELELEEAEWWPEPEWEEPDGEYFEEYFEDDSLPF